MASLHPPSIHRTHTRSISHKLFTHALSICFVLCIVPSGFMWPIYLQSSILPFWHWNFWIVVYGHRSNIYGGYIQSIPTHKNKQKINANVLVCDLFRMSWLFNPSWGISPGLNHVYGNMNASLGKSRLFYSLPLISYRLYSQNTLTLQWWSSNILNAIKVEWIRVYKSIETAISVEL